MTAEKIFDKNRDCYWLAMARIDRKLVPSEDITRWSAVSGLNKMMRGAAA